MTAPQCVGAPEGVADLEVIAAAQEELTALTEHAVVTARRQGASWQQIADTLGFPSGDAAEFRYGIE